MAQTDWQPLSDQNHVHGSPLLPRLRSSQLPRLKGIMFQEVPPANMSVRRRILLMSIVLTGSNLAVTLTKSSRVYLFQQTQCLIYYQLNDPTKIDPKNGVEESLCKLAGVQYPLSIIVGIDSVLSLLPGKAPMPCPLVTEIDGNVCTNAALL